MNMQIEPRHRDRTETPPRSKPGSFTFLQLLYPVSLSHTHKFTMTYSTFRKSGCRRVICVYFIDVWVCRHVTTSIDISFWNILNASTFLDSSAFPHSKKPQSVQTFALHCICTASLRVRPVAHRRAGSINNGGPIYGIDWWESGKTS